MIIQVLLEDCSVHLLKDKKTYGSGNGYGRGHSDGDGFGSGHEGYGFPPSTKTPVYLLLEE